MQFPVQRNQADSYPLFWCHTCGVNLPHLAQNLCVASDLRALVEKVLRISIQFLLLWFGALGLLFNL